MAVRNSKRDEERHVVWMKANRSCQRCIKGNHAACYGGQMVHKRGSYNSDEKVKFDCFCQNEGHHSFDGRCTGSSASGAFCGRPAKHIIQLGGGERGGNVSKSDSYTVEYCGIHANAVKVQRETTARYDAAHAAARERNEESARARRSNIDWAERLREEFGIDSTPDRDGVTLNPEILYGKIVKADEVLRDVLPEEENPFRLRQEK